MNLIKRFFSLFQLLITGLFKFVRDYAIPAINFINAIKDLIENPITDKKAIDAFDYKKFFTDKLNIAYSIISNLLAAFKAAMLNLFPDIGEEKSYSKMILAYANYIRTLEKNQRNMVYFKTVSLMLVELINPRTSLPDNKEKISSSDADLLAQLSYSYNRHKKIG